ncbi:golgin subfamily A member 6-like protein 22 [Antennarius striatus]|uniref:golgin subfamily A member 6-like protein 22 n=1 Tax=Antennarius striatus TaxID=241820 RepID=UPI0035B33D93
MDDRGHDGTRRDPKDTEELLYMATDLIEDGSGFVLDPPPRKLDHCDLLLDAIDAQLGQLQVRTQKCQVISKERDFQQTAPLRWSHSLSKDTGLGSTSQSNDAPMSCLDLIQTPTMTQKAERVEDLITPEERKQELHKRTRDNEQMESEREQIIWRLERLLGDTYKEGGMAGEIHSPSDSICTEDFVKRFRDEMVEIALPGRSDSCQISRGVEVVPSPQQNNSHPPQARCSAGVPMWSLDGVSTDSDLNSVSTSEVRQQIHRQPGWKSFIQCVTDKDDYSTTQSDFDTLSQEESEPISMSGKSSCYGDIPKRISAVFKPQHNKREDHRIVCSVGDSKDTDEEINHWNRRCRKRSEKMKTDWARMKEHLSVLRQKCKKEEETLQLKKTLLKDVELSISELQKTRKHALHELERLTKETAKMQTEKNNLEFVLEHSKTGKNSISCQQQELQGESCMFGSTITMTTLEREEMDRQLDTAKTELFAEQRRSREKLESIQEMLEETREELHRVTEEESSLRSRCACLEEKQWQKKDHIKAAEFQVGELQGELGECQIRMGSLERMVAQKELQLLELKESRAALREEGDRLKGELQHLKIHHTGALSEAGEQAQRITEAALKQQKKDLTLAHEQHIQKLKEEEAKKLRDCLEEQEQEAKNREEELHEEALEKVHKAIEAERKKWEAEKMEAVKINCAIMKEQNRESLEIMRSELQREKRDTVALQQKVVELNTRLQELENKYHQQQREQESFWSAICESLKEEHRAELQKMQQQMEQESQMAVSRLEQAVKQVEKEADRLRGLLAERENSHNQLTAETEQQVQNWAVELGAECQHLHLLVEESGARIGSLKLPSSSTVDEALRNLTTLREQLKSVISFLHQELDSQKQTTERLRNNKDEELSIQRQQLRMERTQALNSLKERLIMKHIEELSSLNWAHLRDGVCDGGGVAASLRKQLKAKDLELRQVQQSMSQWKQQTAARLACKFQEEFTAELER